MKSLAMVKKMMKLFRVPWSCGRLLAAALIAFGLGGAADTAKGATVTANPVTGNIDDASTWDNAAAPSSGNDYVINNASSLVNVPYPGHLSTYTFAGDSMKVQTGILRLTMGGTTTTSTFNLSPTTMAGGTLRFTRDNASTWLVTNTFTFQSATTSTFDFVGGDFRGTANLQGALSGDGDINVVLSTTGSGGRTGILVSNASNTYSGDWNVTGNAGLDHNDHALFANAANALGTGKVTVGTNGVLTNAAASGLNSIEGITMTHANSLVKLNQAWSNSSAYLQANLGTVKINTATASSIGNLSGTGSAVIQSTVSGASLTVTQTTDATYAGSFTQTTGDTLAFTKNGSAKLTLTGTGSDYSGGTTINTGTLLANNASGSATGTGGVTVNGGTLGGSGSITGAVTVNDTGILSPGSSIESLNTGSNDWNDDTTFVFEFSTDGATGSAGTQWDLLAITGSLDLTDLTSATMNLVTMTDATNAGSLGTWNPNVDHTWAGFLTTTTGFTNLDVSKFAFNTSGFQNPLNGTFSVMQNGNNLDLHYTAVPEPGSFAMLLFGAAFLWFVRRSRQGNAAITSGAAW